MFFLHHIQKIYFMLFLIVYPSIFLSSSNLFLFFFGSVWFGLVLWHINHCRLFNAKYSLCLYIKYIGFGLACFYRISTTVGYLMPNLVYMCVGGMN